MSPGSGLCAAREPRLPRILRCGVRRRDAANAPSLDHHRTVCQAARHTKEGTVSCSMPGILLWTTDPSLAGVVPLPISGRWLFSATAVAAVFGAVRYRLNRRVVAERRAKHHLAMLDQASALMEVRAPDLAPYLGLPASELACWTGYGVPAVHQRAVANLFRATVALRRRFPARATRRLLAIRAHRRSELTDAGCHLADLSRRSRPHHIIVTLR
jgi:hypothetical protein